MSDEKVILENDRVRVSRVSIQPRETHEGKRRGDRVIISLTDVHQIRTQGTDKGQEIHHKAGDVVWREASRAEIQNIGDRAIEIVIVEMK